MSIIISLDNVFDKIARAKDYVTLEVKFRDNGREHDGYVIISHNMVSAHVFAPPSSGLSATQARELESRLIVSETLIVAVRKLLLVGEV